MEQTYVVDRVDEMLRRYIMPSFSNVKIVPAKLGNMAGMLGAAREAQKEYQKRK